MTNGPILITRNTICQIRKEKFMTFQKLLITQQTLAPLKILLMEQGHAF